MHTTHFLANLVPQNIARRLSRQPADLLEIFYFKLEFGAPAGGMHLTKKAWKKERKKVLQICGWALPFFLFLAWAATSSVQCTRTPLHCPMTKYIALRPEHRYGTAHCLDAANLWHRPNGTSSPNCYLPLLQCCYLSRKSPRLACCISLSNFAGKQKILGKRKGGKAHPFLSWAKNVLGPTMAVSKCL